MSDKAYKGYGSEPSVLDLCFFHAVASLLVEHNVIKLKVIFYLIISTSSLFRKIKTAFDIESRSKPYSPTAREHRQL